GLLKCRAERYCRKAGGEGILLTLATIPAEDPATYEMIQRADTMGVFQIESRAQMAMLPRLRPACFYDLVIEVAIVRPGPIQGDMVHPYLRRRAGQEPVEYPDERIREVLGKTLGVPIFQEQAMRLAVVAAGFTPGEADQLRRAMGAWRKRGVLDAFEKKLIDGMTANGYTAEFAARVFQQISGFGEYGFPESHSASFALLVYVSAWLKRHYPAAFAAALLNSQPMGFYAPAQLVADARKHGVEVRPVDVNASDWDCTLEVGWAVPTSEVADRASSVGGHSPPYLLKANERPDSGPLSPGFAGERVRVRGDGPERLPLRPDPPAKLFEDRCGVGDDGDRKPPHPNPLPQRGRGDCCALRLGLQLVRGLSRKHAERIVEARNEGGPFHSFADFARRTGLSSAVLATLSGSNAFATLRLNRRGALWESLPEQRQLPLFDALESDEPPVELPALSPFEEVVGDYRAVGLSLRDHPLKFVRPLLDKLRVVRARDLATLPADRRYKVGGLVLLRQRPSTANGITFVTLEDETGMANLIVRQDVWEKYRRVARRASAMIVHGRLQRQEGVIHILADKLEDLSRQMAAVDVPSRDFR
ncbi:MAG: OB-fold nucleic acid binding domain-containing protein, partial [Planctomycetales bacterium]